MCMHKSEKAEISMVFTDIFRSSQVTGQIVEDWKVMNITPLLKKRGGKEWGA